MVAQYAAGIRGGRGRMKKSRRLDKKRSNTIRRSMVPVRRSVERQYDAFANRWKHGGGRNTNYVRGRNFEYSGMAILRRLGFICMRSFGSIGSFDFLAFRHGTCLLVQSKWSSMHSTGPGFHDLTRLISEAAAVGAFAVFQGIQRDEKSKRGTVSWFVWKRTIADDEPTWVRFEPAELPKAL